jgi:hypothetical protein
MFDAKRSIQEQMEPAQPHLGRVSRFGEFDDTGTGTDLTLEWDSNDPELHDHLAQMGQSNEWVEPRSEGEGDYYRYFNEAGLPAA